jgi:hypothetical protein
MDRDPEKRDYYFFLFCFTVFEKELFGVERCSSPSGVPG